MKPTYVHSIADLQEQVNAFRRRYEQAEAKLNRLKAGSTPFTRPPGVATRITSAEEDLHAARQALRNAERLYQTARTVRDRDGP